MHNSKYKIKIHIFLKGENWKFNILEVQHEYIGVPNEMDINGLA